MQPMITPDIETRRFAAGDVLFAPGAAADNAYVLIAGRVRVAAGEGNGEPVIFGPGAIVGDLDLLLNQPHSTTAVALDDVSTVPLSRLQITAAIQRGPRHGAARTADVLDELARTVAAALGGLDESPAGISDDAPGSRVTGARIAADDRKLAQQVDNARLALHELPYVVGRNPTRHESPPRQRVDLALDDRKPFQLSRRHFAIDRDADGLVLRDLGSQLGTEVNGVRIGIGRSTNAARLRPGENLVVAGRTDSPYRFRISVETC